MRTPRQPIDARNRRDPDDAGGPDAAVDARAEPAAHRLGRRGEGVAEGFYRRRLYTVIARNWRPPGRITGEIDLILRRGQTLVFVEVKTRRTGAAVDGIDAIDQRKRDRFRRAVAAFLDSPAAEPWRIARIDVVVVEIDRRGRVTHFDRLADAFGG